MTRMMKLDRTYRIYMLETVTREYYIDVVAKNFEDAEDKAYEQIDLGIEEHVNATVIDRYTNHELDEIEELNTSQEQ